jgi:hypothetical protein
MSENGMVGATLSVTQTVTLFTVLMPSVSDVNRHMPDDNHPFTADVRQSELIAGVLSLSVGAIMSRIEHSWTPFIAAAFLVAILIAAYEYTLHRPGNSPNLIDVTERMASHGDR